MSDTFDKSKIQNTNGLEEEVSTKSIESSSVRDDGVASDLSQRNISKHTTTQIPLIGFISYLFPAACRYFYITM